MNNNICAIIDFNDFSRVKTLYGEEILFCRDNVSVAVLGNLYNRAGGRLDAEGAHKLYLEYGEDVYLEFDGIFTVMIFDHKNQKAFVLQDFFGSQQAIFYYSDNEKMYITNSLRSIVTNEKREWKMDRGSAHQFILRGYSADNKSLIEGINMMPCTGYLYVDVAGRKHCNKAYKKEPNPKRVITNEIYNKVLEDQIKACLHDKMATTVSSGYDSNYILYNLNKFLDNRIDGFCIGGKTGQNEIPDAEKIAAYYGNIDLHTKQIGGQSFDMLPEIIYVLEGSMYERGIFLQYELAKLVKEHGVENIILGESADQVLNFEMYHPRHQARSILKYNSQKFLSRYLKGLHYRPYRTVYDMASYIVIKKNGIMMNYFGVNTEYPYMRKEYMKMAENAVKIGERKKEFHKKVFGETLPKEITDVVHKMPGSTELKDLFIGDITYEAVLDFCKKSEFYEEKKFDDIFYEIDNYIKITYLETFKKMFIDEAEKYLTDTYKGYKLKELFPELVK
ncbi:MAG: hypothetical protein E7591_03310 [Ruminococcaceae bacterium]|nr:hypothetical protein [Oscillospiraceae bacterium]